MTVKHFTVIVALAGLLIGLPACETASVDQSLTAEYAGNDMDSQMEFWHSLANRRLTSNDDAFHGVLLFLNDQDDNPDYESRVQALKDSGLLPAGFDRPAQEAVTRGTLAVILVNALQIKGGVMMHLVGPQPRYAVRELTAMGIYPLSSPHQVFAGDEFIDIIGRAEDYQRRVNRKARAHELDAAAGGEAEPAAEEAEQSPPAEEQQEQVTEEPAEQVQIIEEAPAPVVEAQPVQQSEPEPTAQEEVQVQQEEQPKKPVVPVGTKNGWGFGN